ncbi:MAG: [protein-PII] uridylyltransferase, partial [bacterium]
HSEVVVVTRDRERLFCKIAGSFAMTGLNILSADVFTRGDNLVIDTFRVCTDRYEAATNALDRKNFKKTIAQSFQDENFNLRDALQQKQEKIIAPVEDAEFPTRLTLDNETSREHTLLHIQTPDRIGLLYDITSCFADLNIVIAHSRITTEKGAALDTFYLTLPQIGKIVDPALQEKLLQALRGAIALQK